MQPKQASFVAGKLTQEGARQWCSAWTGNYRQAPSAPNGQALAGSLLMQIALSRPAAREAWQTAIVEAERDGTRRWRRKLEEERRLETHRINASIMMRPPPTLGRDWQPPSPSRVAGGWGRNLDVSQANAADSLLSERKAQLEAEQKARVEEEVKAELQAAEQAEADWWSWYQQRKDETQREQARMVAEAAKAEEDRLRRKEEARIAKMEQMRKEEAIRKAKVKAEAERVEKANAEQRKQVAAAEEAERKRKADEVKAARKAKQEGSR